MLFRFSLTTHKNGYNPIEKCDDTKLTGGQFRLEWGGQHDRNIQNVLDIAFGVVGFMGVPGAIVSGAYSFVTKPLGQFYIKKQ
ncbi:MAG: hypothetical protein A3D31_01105 [Candidatus Fluviicola riflensis]|nr:MAG: hypothetical protein CHH17_04435 [Candidatus Fluviicola riflensis]OGS76204.1 MAG: hypothetical protein A3D31_01105 [Candidatus Fluviicola riflensis]OGS83252.1 MAG: hypothetical protein A2724_00735 [Fluviicola sp. RIFCSPHIGHO2_01_FULL_43_53]OGS83736.1 MAG: hypothetical protein A3E30_17710 [Fluviicola sp. RIFCSPHIGHO2_12_FULL_43_24]